MSTFLSLLKSKAPPRQVIFGTCIFVFLIFIFNGNLFSSKKTSLQECSLDIINSMELEQDDPCVVKIIKDKFLFPPSSEPLNVQSPADRDPSVGQAQIVRELNKNQVKGFFVECGALDGEVSSNTLYMERNLQWEGLLIEADPKNFNALKSKNRKVWAVPACISSTGQSKIVTFKQGFDVGKITDFADGSVKRPGEIEVQCFPFYSILLALGRTQIDFFSLDIEGGELDVLKTIPWKRVDIKMLAVEYLFIKEGKAVLAKYMADQGYEVAREYNRTDWRAYDYIFVKK